MTMACLCVTFRQAIIQLILLFEGFSGVWCFEIFSKKKILKGVFR